MSVACDGGRVPRFVVPDRSIMTTSNGVFVYSEEASTWSTALIMSSGSYSGLAMHELDHRKRKELITSPKFSSSGMAEQYVIPPDIEQLRGLTKSSVLLRNVLSNACLSVGGIA